MLGVCYYPEHWPEEWWARDAKRMVELGIRYVRIGEFAWSRLEPSRGQFTWDWLDRAMDVLSDAGLKVVLGTPTATPPKWLMDEHPDIAPFDIDGKPRGFGSRRHYSFSSEVYWKESARIVEAVAQRYGQHPGLAGWQTDNEYGCHMTILSWGPEDLRAFKRWLRQRYQSTDQLNEAWGNVFWSMELADFEQISLPNLTVTESNPAAKLDLPPMTECNAISFANFHPAVLSPTTSWASSMSLTIGMLETIWIWRHGIHTPSVLRNSFCRQKLKRPAGARRRIQTLRRTITISTAPLVKVAGG
jgi:beta-galactosidase GanA